MCLVLDNGKETTMKTSVYIAVAAAWLLILAWVASAEEASVLLEKGIYTEETQGDPSAAIPIYEQVLAETQADRQVIAQAHFHLAVCHRKLKQDAKARELLKQFLQRYEDQEALVAKARPILEELTEFDPATLMPPDTLLYIELGSPGAQLEKVLKMLEGTPFANPLTAIPTQTQPSAAPTATQPQPGEFYPGPAPGSPGQLIQALLNPSMIKEFKKLRSAAAGLQGLMPSGPSPVVAVLQPGESDAIRGILTAVLVAAGQPASPIEGMQVVQFEGDAACAFDDEVFIVASPPAQLEWSVRQYKGAEQPSLATANKSFTSLAPVASRRHDALTVWADPARLLEAARPMLGRGGMRDLAMISALADIPNMDGAVGRLTLAENGLMIEASVAYKPTHRSVFYDLVRTPPMSGAAFVAVPPQAAALVGVALQPPGAGPEAGAPGDEMRGELVRRVTGLDLGRELFGNIQEIALFLAPAGEGIAGGREQGVAYWYLAARSLGVVIVSRDPAQTRAVLERLLALPQMLSGQAPTQPAPDRTEYDLVSTEREKITAYLGQEGHTTVLALNPTVRDAALEALRSGRNARTDGPLAKALAEAQGRSKVAIVSVGGVLGLIDAVSPPPATTQPTTGEASEPAARSTLAQLAAVLADTTVRLETVEQDDAFTIRLTAADIPPLKDVFPLLMQLQQEGAARRRAQMPPPQERNKLLRRAAMEFLAALQKNDQAAATALVVPGSPAAGKIQALLATKGLQTFQFQEMRRRGDLGWVLVHDDGADPAGAALLIHLHKQPPGGPTWLVTDVESLPVGTAAERIRDLAPNVVPVTRASLAQAEVGADAGAQALAAVSAVGAPEVTPPKALQPTADKFVSALGRRDEAAIKALIVPGSAAEGKVSDVLTKADFSTFRVREVRRNGPIGIAVALDDPPPGRAAVGTLIIQLRMIEESVWRVTDLNYVPLLPSQLVTQPSTQPAGSSGPSPSPGPDSEAW